MAVGNINVTYRVSRIGIFGLNMKFRGDFEGFGEQKQWIYIKRLEGIDLG